VAEAKDDVVIDANVDSGTTSGGDMVGGSDPPGGNDDDGGDDGSGGSGGGSGSNGRLRRARPRTPLHTANVEEGDHLSAERLKECMKELEGI
jgi:hypothetical protein